MLTNLRNAFDGQIMTFNPKYGKTRSGIFGMSMVTTNMSSEQVLAGVGNRRSEEIASKEVKVSHSLIAVGAVGVRVPLYLGHS